MNMGPDHQSKDIWTKKVKLFLVATTMVMVILAGNAWARLDLGIEAYQEGKYKEAMDIFIPLAILDDSKAKHYLGLIFVK